MALTADAQARLEALAAAQGVRPVENIDELAFADWPEDETPDDLITAVREWRREGAEGADPA